MFIEQLLTSIRAPDERNVSGDQREIEHVSLLWSDGESLAGRAFYKHFVPTGRGSCARKTLSEKRQLRTCSTESTEGAQRKTMHSDKFELLHDFE